jgi:hypothetical protein
MKAAFSKGKDRFINAIATESMLRYLPGKTARHTIKRTMQVPTVKTKSATDTIAMYTRDVLPRIEDSIERRLLQQYISSLHSLEEQNEIISAYEQRKHEISKIEGAVSSSSITNDVDLGEDYDPDLNPMENIKPTILKHSPEKVQELKDTIWSMDGKGVSYHTYDTIGKFTIFPKSHWKRMFPRDSCGLFDNNDFKNNDTYGLMCTEEGLKITYDLSRRSLPSQRKLDYAQLIKNDVDTKELLKDEQTFIQLYQDFSIDLLDRINAKGDNSVKRVFESPAIFDGIIGVLLREMRKKTIRKFILYQPTRYKIMDQFIDMLVELFESEDIHLRELRDVIELRRMLEVELVKSDLGEFAEHAEFTQDTKKYKIYLQGHQKYCFHFWRPEDMRQYALQRFKGFNST